MKDLSSLKNKIRNCNECINTLPLKPQPIIRGTEKSKLMIIGQAPGIKAHETITPWNDKSGDRLRNWLNIHREEFYNENNIAIMPMGFCYPGKDKHGGDKPPISKCAPLWHQKFLDFLPNIKLTLLVGSYSQKYYLEDKVKKTLSLTVKSWKEYFPKFIPLPHPSWRNTGWLKTNPWFENELLPEFRKIISDILEQN